MTRFKTPTAHAANPPILLKNHFSASAPPSTPATALGTVRVDLGWVSAGDIDGEAGVGESPWERTLQVDITFGDAVLNIDGGPNGPVTATGTTAQQVPFFKQSAAILESDIGSFGMGIGEFEDLVTVGANVAVFQADVVSTIDSRQLIASGGPGGDGGGPGSYAGGDGADGASAGNGQGAPGGAGGAGLNEGGAGGDGGNGAGPEAKSQTEGGLFDGVIELWVRDL